MTLTGKYKCCSFRSQLSIWGVANSACLRSAVVPVFGEALFGVEESLFEGLLNLCCDGFLFVYLFLKKQQLSSASPHSARNISHFLMVTITMSSLLKCDYIDSLTFTNCSSRWSGKVLEVLSLTVMCTHHLINADLDCVYSVGLTSSKKINPQLFLPCSRPLGSWKLQELLDRAYPWMLKGHVSLKT